MDNASPLVLMDNSAEKLVPESSIEWRCCAGGCSRAATLWEVMAVNEWRFWLALCTAIREGLIIAAELVTDGKVEVDGRMRDAREEGVEVDSGRPSLGGLVGLLLLLLLCGLPTADL